jgi:cobalt/nickel transport system ATP-binding protein
MSDVLFDLKAVCYDYPSGQTALDGIDLEIREGDHVALLGANACGKSTLLHVMDGLCFPASGEIRAFGRVLTQSTLNDHQFRQFFRSEVGLLFQNVDAQLFSALVEDDIAFAPLQLGLSERETRDRVMDCARLCGVEELLPRPPHALSGGEKKRVALASVLAANPSVLLLDEPTAGLDPRTELWLGEMLDRLAAGGKTIVMATHDLTFAAEFAGCVAAMGEDHRIAAQGTPREILSDQELLLRLNLIHSHAHKHGHLRHAHPHFHGQGHGHAHKGSASADSTGQTPV